MIVKTPRRSVGFFDAAAERMATHPRIVAVFERHQQAMLVDLQVEGRMVLKELAREWAQGEQLRVYVAKVDDEHRDARQERIHAAIRSGEAPTVIARREGVTERHVRRMRGRLGPARTD